MVARVTYLPSDNFDPQLICAALAECWTAG